MDGPIQAIIQRRLRRSEIILPPLPDGYVFLTDERNRYLRDEQRDFLIDRKDEENG